MTKEEVLQRIKELEAKKEAQQQQVERVEAYDSRPGPVSIYRTRLEETERRLQHEREYLKRLEEEATGR